MTATLSGGERRRLAIATLLLSLPALPVAAPKAPRVRFQRCGPGG